MDEQVTVGISVYKPTLCLRILTQETKPCPRAIYSNRLCARVVSSEFSPAGSRSALFMQLG